MKKLLWVILTIILVCNLSAQNKFDSIDFFNKIDKENSQFFQIKQELFTDGKIALSGLTRSEINGICISGSGTLYSDSSLIRIIMIDNSGNEHLMYESSAVFDDIGEINFHNRMDESFLLSSFTLREIVVQLIDENVKIDKISAYQTVEKTKEGQSELRTIIRKEIDDTKLEQVQKYIKKHGMIWKAGNTQISNNSYAYKKSIFGDHYNTFGFEYYQSGIFETLINKSKREQDIFKSVTTTSFVDEFDWRNRHGQNWMTSVKCQVGCFFNDSPIDCSYQDFDFNDDSLRCANDGGEYRGPGTCWAFASVGGIEAVTNLYFNQHLDFDLSEQQLVSCCNTFDRLTGFIDFGMEQIIQNGIVDESCNPYIAQKGSCNSICSSPVERIFPQGMSNEFFNENNYKTNLMKYGPLPCKMAYWSHALLLVGWSKIEEGDQIDWQAFNGSPSYIGLNFWILKNSFFRTGWPDHEGYIYMVDCPDYAYSYYNPVSAINFSEADIACSDNDNDGYYWWGIGNQPSTCPACTPDEPDGDDSNPNFGPMDEYGNLTSISQPYLFPDLEVASTETWTSNVSVCGNVVVKSTGNLTVAGSIVSLSENKTFNVEIGGELLITEGSIE